ncbi:hypothetical protein NE686_17030 [Tissierella carlieri]|uniref:Uncharacterized protein n=1 Tax=Tissierella carlieri TaxID=689904 RepID=A0ABT1SEB2_9FIRM|nr:hypothetical protein [Tissierella carlieri]MCQ4924808.1 hypothetical protein [Tissierella carlieri]
MKKPLLVLTVCFLLITVLSINMSFAKDMYNPEDITCFYYSDRSDYRESWLEGVEKSVSKLLEKYDDKVYVKQYSSFDELKEYFVRDDTNSTFYDPEIIDKNISLRYAYRINRSSDVFEAIFVDCEEK